MKRRQQLYRQPDFTIDEVWFTCASAAQLPFLDQKVDLVFQSTVFTSILAGDLKQRVASEVMRVVRPDGLILWYDYLVNNPWNSDVRGVKRREISQLFPDYRIELERITLLPPLTRFTGSVFVLRLLLTREVSTALFSLFRRYSESGDRDRRAIGKSVMR